MYITSMYKKDFYLENNLVTFIYKKHDIKIICKYH